MANIDVVRKRPTSIWVWVIAAIIVALVLFALFAMRGNPSGSPVSDFIGPTLTVTTTVVV
jgi:hypothetical protein